MSDVRSVLSNRRMAEWLGNACDRVASMEAIRTDTDEKGEYALPYRGAIARWASEELNGGPRDDNRLAARILERVVELDRDGERVIAQSLHPQEEAYLASRRFIAQMLKQRTLEVFCTSGRLNRQPIDDT